MKLPFKRVKEIISEEIDSLSILKEGVWNFEIDQQKGTSGIARRVKATTSDIEFKWGRKDRNSTYGMDPYLRWAPTGKGAMWSTLGELQWPGDPFTYEKIEGSSRSNPKARVVTGPLSKKNVLGKIATIKDKPRIDAWWEPEDVIQFDEIPIVSNQQPEDDQSPSVSKIASEEQQEKAAVREIYKNLSSSVLKLREALREDWSREGLNYDTEPENIYSLLLLVNDAIFGPYAAGGLDFGRSIPHEKVRAAVARAVNKITMLVLGVGPNLKKYYIATGSDSFAGFLMSDKVRNLAFDVVTNSTDLVNELAKLAPGIGLDEVNLYKIYNGPPEGSSGNWWQYEEEQAAEGEAGIVFVRDIDDTWQEFQSEDGKTFYYNKETDESTRSMPITDRISQWWNSDDEEEDTGNYQESFKISSQRLSQLIKEELQLIVEAQDPQGQGGGEEYLGVAAPAIKADKTKRLRTMRASIAALTSKINQECGASGDSSSCDSDKDQLSDLQAQEQELAQS